MRNALLSALLAITTSAAGLLALAEQDRDWRAQLSGFDGVVISCKRSLKGKVTDRICRRVLEHLTKHLERLSIAVESRGIWHGRDETPPMPAAFSSPLEMQVIVNAVARPLAMDIQIRAAVSYENAVEQGQTKPPRKGTLIMWQKGVTGAGSRRQLERQITRAAQQQADKFLTIMKENWPAAQ